MVGKLWTAGVSTCGQQGRCPSGCPRSRPQLIHDLPSASFHVRNKHLLQAHFILEETVWVVQFEKCDKLNPYLTHTINIHLKTTYCVIKNLRVALHLEK